MVQAIVRSIASVVALAAAALLNTAAMAKPEGTLLPGGAKLPTAVRDGGKMPMNEFIKPFKGAAALVFKDGEVIPVDQDGRVIPACEICTPSLEAKWGPRCVKARRASEKGHRSPTAAAARPRICDKLIGTDVKAVTPISVLRHTGSQCITFFVNQGGQPKAFQYCW